MFRILVRKVHTWLVATLGENTIASMVEEYLLGRGRVTMESCLYGTNDDMSVVSMMSDRLGWDRFLEGRILEHWLVVVSPLLSHRPLQLLPESWGRQYISKLHNVIHKQWMYRNLMIHFQSTDGLTIPEHHEILNRIESYSLAGPDTLLPRHQSLYVADFAALGSGSTSHQLLWLANMETAVAAANLAWDRCSLRIGNSTFLSGDHPGGTASTRVLHRQVWASIYLDMGGGL
jgi:hypothetical protein